MFPQFTGKFGTMRKDQTFSLMHYGDDGSIMGQSDKRIFVFNPANGELRLGGPKGNSFMDLMAMRGATVIRLDSNQAQPLIDAIAGLDPHGHTSLGGGVVLAANKVTVVG